MQKIKHYGSGRIIRSYGETKYYYDAVEALTALMELLDERGIKANLDEATEEISLFSDLIYADFDASDVDRHWRGHIIFKDTGLVIPLDSPSDLIRIVNESRKP